jgi:ketosteroid isomerase-like protein
MPTDEEIAVLAANDAFYAAFDAEDVSGMDNVWAQDAPCACIHPGWDPLVGRIAVIDAWKRILSGGGAPSIRVDSARVLVYGDVALVVCVERVTQRGGPGAALLAATNVFIRQNGSWRISHHHAGPVSPHDESASVPREKMN